MLSRRGLQLWAWPGAWCPQGPAHQFAPMPVSLTRSKGRHPRPRAQPSTRGSPLHPAHWRRPQHRPSSRSGKARGIPASPPNRAVHRALPKLNVHPALRPSVLEALLVAVCLGSSGPQPKAPLSVARPPTVGRGPGFAAHRPDSPLGNPGDHTESTTLELLSTFHANVTISPLGVCSAEGASQANNVSLHLRVGTGLTSDKPCSN